MSTYIYTNKSISIPKDKGGDNHTVNIEHRLRRTIKFKHRDDLIWLALSY